MGSRFSDKSPQCVDVRAPRRQHAVVDAIFPTAVVAAGGAWIGTRFLGSHEATIHPRYRERLLQANENDTVYLENLFDLYAMSVFHPIATKLASRELWCRYRCCPRMGGRRPHPRNGGDDAADTRDIGWSRSCRGFGSRRLRCRDYLALSRPPAALRSPSRLPDLDCLISKDAMGCVWPTDILHLWCSERKMAGQS